MYALLRLDVMDERIDSENLILLEAGDTTNDTNGQGKEYKKSRWHCDDFQN